MTGTAAQCSDPSAKMPRFLPDLKSVTSLNRARLVYDQCKGSVGELFFTAAVFLR